MFQCNRVGHKRSQCPMLKTNGPHKTAAMQQMTYVPSGRKFSPHQCDYSRGEGEMKLACGCMSVIMAGALSLDGQVKLKEWLQGLNERYHHFGTQETRDLQPVSLNHHR